MSEKSIEEKCLPILKETYVESVKEIIQKEIEEKFGQRFRNDDGLFQLDRGNLQEHGIDIINWLIERLTETITEKHLRLIEETEERNEN